MKPTAAKKPPFISTLQQLGAMRKKLGRVVLAGGAFDIIHGGHIEHLKKAKLLGDTLVVHIVGNKRVREKKGSHKPLLDENERAFIVSAIKFVDHVFIYNGRHYDQIVIDTIRPDVLFFNKEGFTPEVKRLVGGFKKFRGKIFVDRQAKKNHSSGIFREILARAELRS